MAGAGTAIPPQELEGTPPRAPRAWSRRAKALAAIGATALVVSVGIIAWMDSSGWLVDCCYSYRPPGPPAIVLQLNGTATAGVDILVTGSQPPSYPGLFRVNLRIGTAYGLAAYLSNVSGAFVEIPFQGSNYSVAWHDADGSGTITSGDDFRVVYPASAQAPALGTKASFLLIWQDGSTAVAVEWLV